MRMSRFLVRAIEETTYCCRVFNRRIEKWIIVYVDQIRVYVKIEVVIYISLTITIIIGICIKCL